MDEKEFDRLVKELRASAGGSNSSTSASDSSVGIPVPADRGYWSALSCRGAPFKTNPPKKKKVSPDVIVVEDDVPASGTEKRPAMTGAERGGKHREAKKHRVEETKKRDVEREDLSRCLRWSRNKGNQYPPDNLCLRLRAGTCPSASGARGPLASIFSG